MDNQNVSLDEWCKDIAGISSMACTTMFEIRESQLLCVTRWLCLHELGEGKKTFFRPPAAIISFEPCVPIVI